ncbi:MAG: THUMP domain-containing protein [Thermoplasmatota archaeon]
MKPDCLLVRYGEIALKGKETRKRFEQRLVSNIQFAFANNDISCAVRRSFGRIYISTDDMAKAKAVLPKIFGITSFSPVFQTKATISSIETVAETLFHQLITDEKTFALRVRRSGDHEFTSQNVANEVGGFLDTRLPLTVDLTNPDFEFFIEIRDDNAFLFTEKIRGPGGMPVGTQGLVLSYVDSKQSLLASWYLLKRGVSILFLVDSEKHEKETESFISDWFIKASILLFDAQKEDIKQINEIIKHYRCTAVCVGNSLDEGTGKVMDHLQQLKKDLTVPLLHPLITTTKQEIQRQCKLLGL